MKWCSVSVLLFSFLGLSGHFAHIVSSKAPFLSKTVPLGSSRKELPPSLFSAMPQKLNAHSDDEVFSPIRVVCDINGFSVAAMIDTGAQISIMSTSCAKRCHLFQQIDTHFKGRAMGIGHGTIVGRIDNLRVQIGPLSFNSRISVLQDGANGNNHVDLLIGLDFLKRFDAEICLRENVLKLYVRDKVIRIPFIVDTPSLVSPSTVWSQSCPSSCNDYNDNKEARNTDADADADPHVNALVDNCSQIKYHGKQNFGQNRFDQGHGASHDNKIVPPVRNRPSLRTIKQIYTSSFVRSHNQHDEDDGANDSGTGTGTGTDEGSDFLDDELIDNKVSMEGV